MVALQCRRSGFDRWVGKILWRRAWQPIPVLLPGQSHWKEKPGGLCPWGHKKSDTTEQLSIYFKHFERHSEIGNNPILHSWQEVNTNNSGQISSFQSWYSFLPYLLYLFIAQFKRNLAAYKLYRKFAAKSWK